MTDTAQRVHRRHAWPEGALERQGDRAGVISRVVAMVVDALMVALICGLGYLGIAALKFVARPRKFQWPYVSSQTMILIAGVVAVVMLAVGWSALGRTAGMRVMGLRVMDRHGHRLGVPLALLRALTCVVFPLGLLWSAISRRNASIHDLIFRTQVVYHWETRAPGGPPAPGDA